MRRGNAISASPFGTPISPSLVLVVEDDADTRSIIRQSVVALGHFVVEAGDGLEAQAAVGQQLPDLILLDLMMPNMTGMEFMKWFRSEFPEPYTPVLMLTALGDVDHKVEGLTEGADDYQVKPFNYRELQARVQSLLRTKSLTSDLYRRTAELQEANERLSKMQAELIAKERELAAAEMAGAAAHNLGQPITTVLLHCRMLEKGLPSGTAKAALDAVAAIKSECEAMREVMVKLKSADARATTAYVGAATIIDIDKSSR